MKLHKRSIHAIFFTFFTLVFSSYGYSQENKEILNDYTWTYTYLKATSKNNKDQLKDFLKKNWFVMDSIAVEQKLIKSYELIENVNATESEWDFIVAVEYYTRETYGKIAKEFEEIRKDHATVTINGLEFKELGKIVKSETVKKEQYLNK